MFNKSDYLQSQVWLEDKYLVHPNGTKLCTVCNKLQYTVEFINYPEFVDGKLPVCNGCFGTTAFSAILGASLIQDAGFTKKCVKCDVERPLEQMRMGFKSGEVLNKCIECK